MPLLLLALAAPFPAPAALSADGPKVPPGAEPQSIYVSLGKLDMNPKAVVGRNGRILQMDMEGRVLGRVHMEGKGYGIAFRRDGAFDDREAPWCLLTALRGTVMRVRRLGEKDDVVAVSEPGKHRAAISVAVSPKTGELLVADNSGDEILAYAGWPPGEPRVLEHLEGLSANELESMSLAATRDGSVYLGLAGLTCCGVFRLRENDREKIGERMLPATFRDFPSLAADAKSNRWAVALDGSGEVHLFEGVRPIAKLECPKGKRLARGEPIAFGTDGNLYVALTTDDSWEVDRVEPASAALKPLFSWTTQQMDGMEAGWKPTSSLSLGVGPRMPWGTPSDAGPKAK
jgi:hypothetical protein